MLNDNYHNYDSDDNMDMEIDYPEEDNYISSKYNKHGPRGNYQGYVSQLTTNDDIDDISILMSETRLKKDVTQQIIHGYRTTTNIDIIMKNLYDNDVLGDFISNFGYIFELYKCDNFYSTRIKNYTQNTNPHIRKHITTWINSLGLTNIIKYIMQNGLHFILRKEIL
jgi:hypothetical protein